MQSTTSLESLLPHTVRLCRLAFLRLPSPATPFRALPVLAYDPRKNVSIAVCTQLMPATILYPWSGSVRCGRRFPLCVAPSLRSLRRSRLCVPARLASSVLFAAASFHCPHRVVRISRRSGNFDSTACASGLQVTPRFSLAGNQICQPRQALARTLFIGDNWSVFLLGGKHKTPLPSGAAFCVYRAGHWPPSLYRPAVQPPCLMQTVPTGLPLVWGRSMADALAGCLTGVGWPGSSQQPVHHWHPCSLQFACRSLDVLISMVCMEFPQSQFLFLVSIPTP